MKYFSTLIFVSIFIIGQAQAKGLNEGIFALKSDILANLLAKELCSCIYVTGAYERFGTETSLKMCLSRANLSLSDKLLKKIEKIDISKPMIVQVKQKFITKLVTGLRPRIALASYDKDNPQNGCSFIWK